MCWADRGWISEVCGPALRDTLQVLGDRELTKDRQAAGAGVAAVRAAEGAGRAAAAVMFRLRQRGGGEGAGAQGAHEAPRRGARTLMQGGGGGWGKPIQGAAGVGGGQEVGAGVRGGGLARGWGLLWVELVLGSGRLEGRVHLQQGVGEELCDVGTGGRSSGGGSPQEGPQGRRRECRVGLLQLRVGGGGEAGKAEALPEKRGSAGAKGPGLGEAAGGGGRGRARVRLLQVVLVVVDKVAADPVGAEADGVERATWLRFVFGMPVEVTQLVQPMGKLALVAIFAHAALSE